MDVGPLPLGGVRMLMGDDGWASAGFLSGGGDLYGLRGEKHSVKRWTLNPDAGNSWEPSMSSAQIKGLDRRPESRGASTAKTSIPSLKKTNAWV